jgi:hypothetical protein
MISVVWRRPNFRSSRYVFDPVHWDDIGGLEEAKLQIQQVCGETFYKHHLVVKSEV